MQKLVLHLIEETSTEYKTFLYESKDQAVSDLNLALLKKKAEMNAVSDSNRIFQKEMDLLQEVQKKEIVEGKSALDKKIQSLRGKMNRFDPNFKFGDLSLNYFDCLDTKILTLDEWYDSKN